jgi:hypothetical protein
MGFRGEQIGLEIVKGQWKLSGLNELNCMALNIGQHMQQEKRITHIQWLPHFRKGKGKTAGENRRLKLTIHN